MNRLIARTNEEGGAALVICLVFLGFFGVVALALLNYTTTSLKSTVGYREVRDRVYAADGVAEGAINRVRSLPPGLRNQDGCFESTLNGQSLRVDCSGTPLAVTFKVCPSAVAAPCPDTNAELVAIVQYASLAPDALIDIDSWSVRK